MAAVSGEGVGQVAVHVVTVGVSVLTNARRAGKLAVDPHDEAGIEQVLRDPAAFRALVDFVEADPWRASAELSAMRPFLERDPLSANASRFGNGLEVEEAYLVATSTQPGALARAVLETVLKEHFGVRVSGQGPPVLPQGDEEAFVESLRGLWEALLSFVEARRADGCEVAINATGGFKPELAVCLIAGNLTGVPVYYRHEHYGSTIILPTLVWPLCPPEIRVALQALCGGELSGPDAARFDAEHDGRRLERLRLVQSDRDDSGGAFGVRLLPYGRLLLELQKAEARPGLGGED